jgi:threonine/homoserine/homoserine lactone efflux protein
MFSVFSLTRQAWRLIWRTAGNGDLNSCASRKNTWSLLKSGFGIGIGNPKAILFHASLLPVFFDLRSLTLANGWEISALVLIVDMLVLASVAAAAGNAARLLLPNSSPQAGARRRCSHDSSGRRIGSL